MKVSGAKKWNLDVSIFDWTLYKERSLWPQSLCPLGPFNNPVMAIFNEPARPTDYFISHMENMLWKLCTEDPFSVLAVGFLSKIMPFLRSQICKASKTNAMFFRPFWKLSKLSSAVNMGWRIWSWRYTFRGNSVVGKKNIKSVCFLPV